MLVMYCLDDNIVINFETGKRVNTKTFHFQDFLIIWGPIHSYKNYKKALERN